MNTAKAKEFYESHLSAKSFKGIVTKSDCISLMTGFAEQEKKIAFEAGAREMRENIKQEYNEYLGNGIINPEMAIQEAPLPEYKEGE